MNVLRNFEKTVMIRKNAKIIINAVATTPNFKYIGCIGTIDSLHGGSRNKHRYFTAIFNGIGQISYHFNNELNLDFKYKIFHREKNLEFLLKNLK